VSLTPRQARALAGEWYLWFVERHPVTDARHWEDLRDQVNEALTECYSSEEDAADPDALYRDDPKVREAIRPLLADIGETAQFLALKRIVLNEDARGKFLDHMYDDLAAALRRLIGFSRGDYSPDKYAERFPNFTEQTPARRLGNCSSNGWMRASRQPPALKAGAMFSPQTASL
jgi:hypothetical protein